MTGSIREAIKAGINAAAIHGNKSQGARQTALKNFKNRTTRVLVATDIAARGIDVEQLSHVINFEIPNIPETYIHRIGRTGRAGLTGFAFSFCDAEEKAFLKDIHKLLPRPIPVIEDHPYSVDQSRISSPADQHDQSRGSKPSAQRNQSRGSSSSAQHNRSRISNPGARFKRN